MQTMQFQITEKYHRRDGRSFEISTHHGWLESVYRPHLDECLIANIQSTRPRQGIGKFLLRASLEHAKNLGADYMTAMIISRECLDDMISVFGQENVEIERIGEYNQNVYTDDDTASALLYYPLDHKINNSIYSTIYER